MRHTRLASLVLAAGLTVDAQKARAYDMDCAIMLCMAGGFPSSAVCSAAYAEMIRRITPWPVEPPLQIWRCPMGASYESDRLSNVSGVWRSPSVES